MWAFWAAVGEWFAAWFKAAQPQRLDYETTVKLNEATVREWEKLVGRLTTKIDEQANEYARHTEERDKEEKRYRAWVAERFKEFEAENEECRKESREQKEEILASSKSIFAMNRKIVELTSLIEELKRSDDIRSDPGFQQRTAEHNKKLLESLKPESPVSEGT